MSAKQLEKLVLSNGWKYRNAKGSHRQYTHPIKKGVVTIPFHRGDLKKGTLHSILKQAGLEI